MTVSRQSISIDHKRNYKFHMIEKHFPILRCFDSCRFESVRARGGRVRFSVSSVQKILDLNFWTIRLLKKQRCGWLECWKKLLILTLIEISQSSCKTRREFFREKENPWQAGNLSRVLIIYCTYWWSIYFYASKPSKEYSKHGLIWGMQFLSGLRRSDRVVDTTLCDLCFTGDHLLNFLENFCFENNFFYFSTGRHVKGNRKWSVTCLETADTWFPDLQAFWRLLKMQYPTTKLDISVVDINITKHDFRSGIGISRAWTPPWLWTHWRFQQNSITLYRLVPRSAMN